LTSVVFPLPRKPVTSTTGTRGGECASRSLTMPYPHVAAWPLHTHAATQQHAPCMLDVHCRRFTIRQA
jgi:hypothetical protein